MSKGVIIGGAIVIAVVALFAGAFLGPRVPFVASMTGADSVQAGPGGTFGPMGQMTDEERQQLQSMSGEERRAFMQEKFGGSAPAGGPKGGAPRGERVVLVEGQILDVAADSITVKTTAGGSQVIYLDDATAVGFPPGSAQPELRQGDAVVITASPEADNVTTAKAIVVK